MKHESRPGAAIGDLLGRGSDHDRTGVSAVVVEASPWRTSDRIRRYRSTSCDQPNTLSANVLVRAGGGTRQVPGRGSRLGCVSAGSPGKTAFRTWARYGPVSSLTYVALSVGPVPPTVSAPRRLVWGPQKQRRPEATVLPMYEIMVSRIGATRPGGQPTAINFRSRRRAAAAMLPAAPSPGR